MLQGQVIDLLNQKNEEWRNLVRELDEGVPAPKMYISEKEFFKESNTSLC